MKANKVHINSYVPALRPSDVRAFAPRRIERLSDYDALGRCVVRMDAGEGLRRFSTLYRVENIANLMGFALSNGITMRC